MQDLTSLLTAVGFQKRVSLKATARRADLRTTAQCCKHNWEERNICVDMWTAKREEKCICANTTEREKRSVSVCTCQLNRAGQAFQGRDQNFCFLRLNLGSTWQVQGYTRWRLCREEWENCLPRSTQLSSALTFPKQQRERREKCQCVRVSYLGQVKPRSWPKLLSSLP